MQCEVVVHEKEGHDAIRVANMGFACRLVGNIPTILTRTQVMQVVMKGLIRMIALFCRRWEKRTSHGDQTRASMGRSLLLLVIMLGMSSCVSPELIDLNSYDPSHDQIAIAGYYKNQADAMREKAHAQVIAAARYEALFGPEADVVFGARLLGNYYEQTAKELEGIAEAHASVARKAQHHPAAQ